MIQILYQNDVLFKVLKHCVIGFDVPNYLYMTCQIPLEQDDYKLFNM